MGRQQQPSRCKRDDETHGKKEPAQHSGEQVRLWIMTTPEIPDRLLLGPGPSNAHPRVLAAMSQPLLGHMDPAFLEIMEDVKARLRRCFGTTHEMTLPLSATGSAGMEACFVNLLESGDHVVIGVAGVFGERMCEVAHRAGANVHRVEAEWGTPLPEDEMLEAIAVVD